jgi:flagellar biosynthetic protein FliQ/type III secretion protein S
VGILPRAAAAAVCLWLAGGWMMERMSQYLAQAIIRMGAR